MKAAGRDVIILLAICLTAWGVTRIRTHVRQIERLRAQIIYTTTIEYETAANLTDALEKAGFLNGVPRSYYIDRHDDDAIQLLVLADAGILADPRVEGVLRDALLGVCRDAFPGDRVTVSLADAHLTPFHEVFETQQF